MTTTLQKDELDVGETERFAGMLFEAGLAAVGLTNVALGLQLGLYQALSMGPATPVDLAARGGIDRRYAREWLEQQAVAGVSTSRTSAPARMSGATWIERLLYAFNTLHCLPVGLTQQPSAATGTVIRPSTVRRYARQAGITSVDEVPVEHPQFRLCGFGG